MSFITDSVVTNGFEMKYIRFGKGARTMVILPGLSVQSVIPYAADIEKRYELFKKDYTVYLFDRREVVPSAYSVYGMANDTAAAIGALGLKDCYILGVSQGGMIAMALALDYPELVRGLALASTACRLTDARGAAVYRWVSLAENGEREALYLSFAEAVYPPQMFRAYKKTFAAMADDVTDGELQRFVTLAKGITGFDVKDRLSEIRCPVIVIGDKDDAVLGAEAITELAEQFENKKDFTLRMYEGYGHAVYDIAEDFTQTVYEFFK